MQVCVDRETRLERDGRSEDEASGERRIDRTVEMIGAREIERTREDGRGGGRRKCTKRRKRACNEVQGEGASEGGGSCRGGVRHRPLQIAILL